MGVTPLDWACITGLRFRGETIRVTPGSVSADDAMRILGFDAGDITRNSIKASALKGGPGFYEETCGGQALDQRRRRLLLYLLVSCFFPNNSSRFPFDYAALVDFPDGQADRKSVV